MKAFDSKGALRESFAVAADNAGQPVPAESSKAKERALYVSIRVTPEEKARLRRDAAGMSISAHVRDRLFGDNVRPRRTRGKFPVKDHEALARVLRTLGGSNLAQDFDAVSWAVREGAVRLAPEGERAITQACADIAAMHRELITALGLKAES